MNFQRLLFLLFLVTTNGCGKSDPGKPPGVPDGASETIVQIRDMVLEASTMAVTLSSEKDLSAYSEKFPKAIAGVKEKSMKIVWGKGLREGATSADAKIIAYEANASKEGGWVVKEDGLLYKLTAAEFAAQAPASK